MTGDHLIIIEKYRVKREALRVFGAKHIASDWLQSPVPALGGKRPVELMDSSEGCLQVLKVLKYIEMGEFS